MPDKIYSDAKRFKQVLFNLIGNAVKFTFQGSITVRVDYERERSCLCISVEDTGIGMKEEDLHKLFRFFGYLKTSQDINRGGMGLGLTISKKIVRELKGDISVTS